uniref:Uncharacterized protein n=1 Tax=Aegilops tauschii subsp. strangulata TaxID=200361 RepID=A0A453K2Q0_AEGTS
LWSESFYMCSYFQTIQPSLNECKLTEISDIKTALNSEIDQLKSDFQELRTTLKKQQEDVTISLKNLGLEDATETDGNKGSGEENTSEGALGNMGDLKLEDNPENNDESSGVEEEKNQEAPEEDDTAGKEGTKTEDDTAGKEGTKTEDVMAGIEGTKTEDDTVGIEGTKTENPSDE